MRLPERKLPLGVLAAVAVLALLPVSCKESNSIAGPSSVSGANLAGTWAGTYFSDDPAQCSSASPSASAMIRQDGSNVTGTFAAASCGISGNLSGSVQGNTFVGRVSMNGCIGGAVSGTLTGSGLSLSVGEFYKPLVTGDQEVLPGGIVTLQR